MKSAIFARVIFRAERCRRYGFDRLLKNQIEESWHHYELDALEPRSRDAEMRTTLQARVYDPLWLLARQWQLGEFQGKITAHR
jgi:hypothetical protein